MRQHAFRVMGMMGILAALQLAGCGGGGGGGSTPADPPAADPPTAYQLFGAAVLAPGYTKTYPFTGTDNLNIGDAYTGTLTTTTQAQGQFNGQPAIPMQNLIILQNAVTGVATSMTETDYYSTDPANLMLLGMTDSGDYSAILQAAGNTIPQTAVPPASGTIGTYTDASTGNATTEAWQLSSAGNGLADFTLTGNTQNGSTFVSSTQITHAINTQGDWQSAATAVLKYANNLTINLTGTAGTTGVGPYALLAPGQLVPGYTEAYTISTGKDSAGNTYTGTLTTTTLTQTTFGGQSVIPVQDVMTLHNTSPNATPATVTMSETDYYAAGTASVMLLGLTDWHGVTWTAAPSTAIAAIPPSATAPASGEIGLYTDASTGETMTLAWQLTTGSPSGVADFMIVSTAQNGSSFVASSQITRAIDTQGAWQPAGSVAIKYSNGLIYDLTLQ
ncbi:MAG: hypothetical protein M0T84_17715 [Betaproteobacteria bacterium]|nr:hypothetical protein [Betaproteobacteria bacterium]